MGDWREPEEEPSESRSMKMWSTSDPKKKPVGGNARMWTTKKEPKPVKKRRTKRTR